MSIEGQPGPHPSAIYNGFSAPVSRLRRGAGSRAGKILMGGVAAAALIGVALGLATRPEVADEDGLRLKESELVTIEVGPGRAPVVPGGAAQAAPLTTLPPGTTAPDVVVVRSAAAPAARPAPRPAAEAGAGDCADAPTPAARLACEGELDDADNLRVPRPRARDAGAAGLDAAEEPVDDLDIPPLPDAEFED